MDKISVIVPVYNVEDYLKECINSILNQNYKNYEIIIVDDGSTDDCSKICDEYKNSNVKVYHKLNGGLSDARNYGIKKASGDYLVFVDSDDVLCKNMLKELFCMVSESGADIGIVDLAHFYGNNQCNFEKNDKVYIYNNEEAICEMLYQKSFLVSACGKIFKKDLFNDIEFPVGKIFEDSAIMYKLFDKSNKIIYNPSKLYGYRHRSDSITTSKFSKKDLDILTISNEIEEYFNNRSLSLKKAAKAYKFNSNLRIFLNASDKFESEKLKSERYLKENADELLNDKNIRKKLKISIIIFKISKRMLKKLYTKVNRWD